MVRIQATQYNASVLDRRRSVHAWNRMTQRALVGLFAVVLASGSEESWAQQGELKILNMNTREERTFIYGRQSFRVDIESVPGWEYCEGRPLKAFEFYGVPAVRAEIFCFEQGGAAMSISCSATRGGGPELVVLQLLGRGAQWTGADEISSAGAVQLQISCLP